MKSIFKIDAAKAAQIKAGAVNLEARKLLADTDWYVTRKAETGAEIPGDVASARKAAREKVTHQKG